MPFPIDPLSLEPEARTEYEHGSFMSAIAISQAISLKRLADAAEKIIPTEDKVWHPQENPGDPA